MGRQLVVAAAMLLWAGVACTDYGDATAADASDGGAEAAPGGESGAASSYEALILAAKPRAYLRLDEDVTPAAVDNTGNGSVGTLAGEIALGRPGALAGDSNPGVALGVGTLEVRPAGLDLSGRNPWTLEVWLVPQFSSYRGLIEAEVGDAGARNGYLFLQEDAPNDGGPEVVCERLYFDGHSQVAAPTPLDHYTYLVFTYDGATTRMHADGREIAAQADENVLPKIDRAIVFNGGVTLDELAIYDRALGAVEIAAHYRAGRGL